MTDPIPLTIAGKGDIVAYACGKCHNVVATHKDFYNAEELARKHCDKPICKTPGCGGDVLYSTMCRKCYDEDKARREAVRVKDAKKVDAKDWKGPVYVEDGDKWYVSVDDLLEDYEEGDEPPYAWGASVVHMGLDASSILESALEEASEEAQEDSGRLADKLQPILDKFCEDNPTEWWEQSDTVVVLDSGFFK